MTSIGYQKYFKEVKVIKTTLSNKFNLTINEQYELCKFNYYNNYGIRKNIKLLASELYCPPIFTIVVYLVL